MVVIRMRLLQHANISCPPQVFLINFSYLNICLIRWHMLSHQIMFPLFKLLHRFLLLRLNQSYISQWPFAPLANLIFVKRLFVFDCVEALNFVLGCCTVLGHIVHMAYHGTIAVAAKHLFIFAGVFYLFVHFLGNVWENFVFEISVEMKTVV